MRGATGLDTQGERSISLPECPGTGPDWSPAGKQDSCGFHSLNTVNVGVLWIDETTASALSGPGT